MRNTLSTIVAILPAIVALVLIMAGTSVARDDIVPKCHQALVFPKNACSKYNGGWMCSGSAVETRMCYNAFEGDPR